MRAFLTSDGYLVLNVSEDRWSDGDMSFTDMETIAMAVGSRGGLIPDIAARPDLADRVAAIQNSMKG